jgi:hypothetical protein
MILIQIVLPMMMKDFLDSTKDHLKHFIKEVGKMQLNIIVMIIKRQKRSKN